MKHLIFLSLLVTLISANKDLFSNKTLENPDDIMGVADGIFEELASLLFYDDCFTCY